MGILDTLRGPTGSLRGNGKLSQAMRKHRRAQIKRSFTRFLARKPMGVGPEAAAWRKGLEDWHQGWQAARDNSATVRR